MKSTSIEGFVSSLCNYRLGAMSTGLGVFWILWVIKRLEHMKRRLFVQEMVWTQLNNYIFGIDATPNPALKH